MRSAAVVTLGVLALGAVIALVSPWLQAPESPARVARAPARTLPGPSTPTPPPRGALSLRGRVLDAQRAPVAGVEVSATRVMPGESLSRLPCDAESPELPLSSLECADVAGNVLMELIEVGRGGAPVLARTTTAADGTFQFDGLPTGTVTLWAMDARGSTLKPNVPTGSEGVELLLAKGATLAGRVVDESSAPVAGAKVTLFDVEGSRYFELSTGADGRFAFPHLPDIPYGLVASSPGLMPHYLPDVVAKDSGLSILLHAPRRLVGRVLAGDRPVAGAQVRVQGTSHVTTTGAEGRFAFEPLAPEEYAVEAEHEGQHGLTFALIAEPGETEATVYLGLLFFVEGAVRDEAGGPVAGATVSVMPRNDGKPRTPSPSATTAADGRFRLGPLRPGRTRFVVEAEQYLDLQEVVDLTSSSPPPTFTLARAVTLEGVVTDAEGQPLEDVRLDAAPKQEEKPAPEPEEDSDTDWEPEMDWNGSDPFFASSDAAGRFRLKVDKPGRYVLTVGGGDHVSTRLEVDAPATGLRLALRGGGSVKGSVVDSRGEPLAEVSLHVRLGTGSTAQTLDTVSDEEGNFLLEGLPPGPHMLEASLKLAGAIHRASRTVEVPGPGTVEAVVRMDTGQSVSGIVVDEQGRPVPDAEVEAFTFFEKWEYPGGSPATAKTGPDGRFTVHHLPEGRCVLSVSKPGYTQDAREEESRPSFPDSARTGARDVRLTLRYQGSVSGRVLHPDGRPVAHFSVYGEQQVTRGTDGDFRLPVERPGRHHLRIIAPGLGSAYREVEVAPGQDLDLGKVRLDPGRRVSGRVVDAETSAPVVGAVARVYLSEEPPDAEDPEARVAMHITSFDGTFTFVMLESRPLRLEVRREGYLPLLQQLGAGDEKLELRLSPGWRAR
ncbi:carboxypeptidase-like regulatory domain-containing protein [Myxococcus sp. RHSTA-1-4]|uniref:carboxypeptidase-like regulatory domain-containing protein n=1 Tax=Myxococcus sp. RHSTA-1-4 TaxID=2874601 RepID=UPI001CBB8C9A|nr:carboxypeptidase-like regulatory domain-containing protein [Myxococcus sp. RHSTA-1-4]MBZ4417481.1 carboxypeptidase-like regulatory domain-containing protein [Myxococcus sp. RHSTA-1-4]